MLLKKYTLRDGSGRGYFHWCPGCKGPHRIQVEGGEGPKWTFNGDEEKPTFSPSVRNFTRVGPDGHYDSKGKEKTLCHYFIEDGQIKFCGDCVHELNGKTVPMPEYPAEYNYEDV